MMHLLGVGNIATVNSEADKECCLLTFLHLVNYFKLLIRRRGHGTIFFWNF